MRKHLLTMIFMLALVYVAHSQTTSVRRMGKIELGLGGIGFDYEAKLGNAVTLDMGIGVGGHYHISKEEFSYVIAHSNDNSSPSLYLSFNPRKYYNLKKRNTLGKNTENNSGNYFGAKIKLVAPLHSNDESGAILGNIHWGLQRSLGKNRRWLFNTHAGIGYGHADYVEYGTSVSGGMVYPSIEAKFAYMISKRRQ